MAFAVFGNGMDGMKVHVSCDCIICCMIEHLHRAREARLESAFCSDGTEGGGE